MFQVSSFTARIRKQSFQVSGICFPRKSCFQQPIAGKTEKWQWIDLAPAEVTNGNTIQQQKQRTGWQSPTAAFIGGHFPHT